MNDELIILLVGVGIWITYKAILLIANRIGQKVRDNAAKKVFAKYKIDFEKDSQHIINKMTQHGFPNLKEFSSLEQSGKIEPGFRNIVKHKRIELIGYDICPNCKNGILFEKSEMHKRFIGCTRKECSHVIKSAYYDKESEEIISSKDLLAKMRGAYE